MKVKMLIIRPYCEILGKNEFMVWPIMGGDKKFKGPAGTTVIADVKGGKVALFFTLLSVLLTLGQDCACIQFCSRWNLRLDEIFV